MNPPDKLIKDLKKKNFLPEMDTEFNTFTELEKSIVEHVFGKRGDNTSVVRFDAECIENANDYTYLIQQFIDAVPSDLDVSEITSNYDANSGNAFCSIKLGGNKKEAAWIQDSDWVTADFIEFMLQITICSKGRFVVMDTGDQTFCAIFLTKGLSDALERYRRNDSGSREAFVSEHASGNLAMFDGIKVLPRQIFKAAVSNLRQRFNNDKNLTDPDAYQTDNIECFICVSDRDDALLSYQIVKTIDNGFTRYAAVNPYNYGAICPDEAGYYLSLKDIEKEVIFQYPARSVGQLVGEADSIGTYALLSKTSDWAIIVDRTEYLNPTFVCLGAAVVNLVSDSVRDTLDNAVAKFYDRIRIDYFEPLVAKLGYSEFGGKFSRRLLMKHDKHWSAVSLTGLQDDVDSDLDIRVIFEVANPVICHVASKKKLPETSFDGDSEPHNLNSSKYGELSWNIANEESFDKVVAEIEHKIGEMHREVSKEISTEQWLQIFTDNEEYWNAAISAYFLGNTELTEKIIRKEYEEATGPNGFWYNRDQVKKLAELLNVNIY